MKPRVKQRFGSAADAATRSGLSVRTVRRLIGRGELAIARVGRRVLIDLVALDAKLAPPASNPPPATAESVAVAATPGPVPEVFPPEGAIFGPDGWELPI
jgi:excisionase family DNA binding protein